MRTRRAWHGAGYLRARQPKTFPTPEAGSDRSDQPQWSRFEVMLHPSRLYQSRFHGRSRLHANLSLEILHLELGDSGTFSALLVDTRGRTETRLLQLTVHEAVTKVTVEVFVPSQRRAGSGEPCEVFLCCTAARGTAVTYSWAPPQRRTRTDFALGK
nr:PREDICTED: SLAM family member 8 [Struthio camelus australis]